MGSVSPVGIISNTQTYGLHTTLLNQLQSITFDVHCILILSSIVSIKQRNSIQEIDIVSTMNTEYKSFLTDPEFEIWQNRLSSIFRVSQGQYLANKVHTAQQRRELSARFGSLCLTKKLKDEEWRTYPSNGDFMISSYGRVMYKDRIVPQKDADGKTGYLVLDLEAQTPKLKEEYVYQTVAATFFEKPDDTNYEIHHITNNGYDNSVGNLIYLTESQHRRVEGKPTKQGNH